jgi:hypothetical protein
MANKPKTFYYGTMMNNKELPWYKRVKRWGQTNLTEIDPLDYNADFWCDYWHKTAIQGIIVNAAGIVAYYPTSFQNQYKAQFLGEKDLYGQINSLARKEGLAVLARMDSNRALPEFYREHPDWFCHNSKNEPLVTQGRYLACVNSPYYKTYLPRIMEEIISLYRPDGFTDNSWTGAGRHYICHCPHCQKKFLTETGHSLPEEANWEDPLFRIWVKWSYRCRMENWDLNNRITQQAGGKDCLWLGMVNGNPVNTLLNFCDLNEVGKRSQIIMTDHQSRDGVTGFEQNSLNGKLLHQVGGDHIIIPESLAQYVRGDLTFRRASNPKEESHLWMCSGFAGGISPWWHHVGARQEDKRQFNNTPTLFQWHKKNEEYLYDRKPIANIGLLWSHENTDFYGRDKGKERVLMPWRGFTRAMTRHRIPFLQIHADRIEEYVDKLDLLILPDLVVMSDSQCRQIETFVAQGGSLIITGRSSIMDETGMLRSNFGLADVMGVNYRGDSLELKGSHPNWDKADSHDYLRLENRDKNELFKDFNETDILPFGGNLTPVSPREDSLWVCQATHIPSFPIYPPEFCWTENLHTDIPMVFTKLHEAGGHLAYWPADIDRCYGERALPDHGRLLANTIKWAVKGDLPFTLRGPGYLDCHLYRQDNRLIFHVCNYSGAEVKPGYMDEFLPVGPLEITIKKPCPGWKPLGIECRVEGKNVSCIEKGDSLSFVIDRVIDHEMIVIEGSSF